MAVPYRRVGCCYLRSAFPFLQDVCRRILPFTNPSLSRFDRQIYSNYTKLKTAKMKCEMVVSCLHKGIREFSEKTNYRLRSYSSPPDINNLSESTNMNGEDGFFPQHWKEIAIFGLLSIWFLYFVYRNHTKMNSAFLCDSHPYLTTIIQRVRIHADTYS